MSLCSAASAGPVAGDITVTAVPNSPVVAVGHAVAVKAPAIENVGACTYKGQIKAVYWTPVIPFGPAHTWFEGNVTLTCAVDATRTVTFKAKASGQAGAVGTQAVINPCRNPYLRGDSAYGNCSSRTFTLKGISLPTPVAFVRGGKNVSSTYIAAFANIGGLHLQLSPATNSNGEIAASIAADNEGPSVRAFVGLSRLTFIKQ
ncbi:MAG: hypothetical protein HY078_16180 [Elusimicrobia bacterium]|nr:hypothetical protein [Elusimicrobiota bacterium]